jgi:hypothetical protein
LTIVVLLLSWFFHTIQYEKYNKVVRYLKDATLNNLPLKEGGNEQTMELHRRAKNEYEKQVQECEIL